MRNNHIYTKLSPSAKNTLEEYLDELKDSILSEAERESEKEDPASSEIRLKDIISAIRTVDTKQPVEDKQSLRSKRMASLLVMTGLVYTLLGVGYYMIFSNSFDIAENIGITMALMGVLVSIVAYFWSKYKTIRTINSATGIGDRDMDLLKRWQIIENRTKEIIDHENGQISKTISFPEIFDFLNSNISQVEVDKTHLEQLLKARNQIVHRGSSLSKNELDKLISYSDNLIDRLDKFGKWHSRN